MSKTEDTPVTVGSGQGEYRIGFLIHDVSRMRRTLFDNEFKPLGLTRSRWWALVQLSRSLANRKDEGMTQTELADKMDIARVTVGGLLDHMEAGGLIVRRPDPNDRRINRVFMTELGHETLTQMHDIGLELNQAVFEGISSDDIKVAEAVLSRMKRNIMARLNQATTKKHDEQSDRSKAAKVP